MEETSSTQGLANVPKEIPRELSYDVIYDALMCQDVIRSSGVISFMVSFTFVSNPHILMLA